MPAAGPYPGAGGEAERVVATAERAGTGGDRLHRADSAADAGGGSSTTCAIHCSAPGETDSAAPSAPNSTTPGAPATASTAVASMVRRIPRATGSLTDARKRSSATVNQGVPASRSSPTAPQ